MLYQSYSYELAITIFDDRFEEERFITIGMDILSRILVVEETLSRVLREELKQIEK